MWIFIILQGLIRVMKVSIKDLAEFSWCIKCFWSKFLLSIWQNSQFSAFIWPLEIHLHLYLFSPPWSVSWTYLYVNWPNDWWNYQAWKVENFGKSNSISITPHVVVVVKNSWQLVSTSYKCNVLLRTSKYFDSSTKY